MTVAQGKLHLLQSMAFWLLTGFALLAAASLFWSISIDDTLREAVLLAGLVAAMFTTYHQLKHEGGQALGLIAAWMVYLASFVSAWGIGTYLFHLSPYTNFVDGINRAGSTFEYSNALSCFGLMALPVTIITHWQAEARDRPLLATAASLQVAAVLVSYARFGILLLIVLALYMVWEGWRKGVAPALILTLGAGLAIAIAAAVATEARLPLLGVTVIIGVLGAAWAGHFFLEKAGRNVSKRIWLAVAVTAAAAGPVAATILVAKAQRLQAILSARFGEGLSISKLLPHRLDTWSGAVGAFKIRPITGSGLGTFAQVYQQYAIATYTKFAHNLLLQTAVDTGLLGVAIMVVFLAYVAALSIWCLWTCSAEPLARAFAVGSLVFIAYNIFDWEWYIPSLAGWFVVGVVCMEEMARTTTKGHPVWGLPPGSQVSSCVS